MRTRKTKTKAKKPPALKGAGKDKRAKTAGVAAAATPFQESVRKYFLAGETYAAIAVRVKSTVKQVQATVTRLRHLGAKLPARARGIKSATYLEIEKSQVKLAKAGAPPSKAKAMNVNLLVPIRQAKRSKAGISTRWKSPKASMSRLVAESKELFKTKAPKPKKAAKKAAKKRVVETVAKPTKTKAAKKRVRVRPPKKSKVAEATNAVEGSETAGASFES